MSMSFIRRTWVLVAVLSPLLATVPATAQAGAGEIVADYTRAERFLGRNADSLITGATVAPDWLSGDRFWYRSTVPGGHEFIVVAPARGTRERAFDHERMARVLTAETGTTYHPLRLPLTRLEPAQDGRGLGFELDRRRWTCDVIDFNCPRPAKPWVRARSVLDATELGLFREASSRCGAAAGV